MSALRASLTTAFAALAACGAAPAVAGAAAPWSPPATVEGGAPAAKVAGPLGLVVFADDSAYLAFHQSPGWGTARLSDVVARRAKGRTAFSPASRTVSGLVAGPVVPRDKPAQATVLTAQRAGARRSRLSVAISPIFRRTTVATAVLDALPVIAAGREGRLAVAWTERRGAGVALRIAFKIPGKSRFGPVRTVSGKGYASAPALAYGEDGTLAVAFQRTTGGVRRVVARTLAPGAGRGFGPLRTVGPSAGRARIAVGTGAGRTVVAYATTDGGQAVNTTTVVRVGRAAKAGGFATSVVDPGGAHVQPSSPPRVVVDAGGSGTVLWTGLPQAPAIGFPLRTVLVGADGAVGAPVTLSEAIGTSALAIDTGGAVTAAWTAGTGEAAAPRSVMAAIRPAGSGTFGPAEEVAGPEALAGAETDGTLAAAVNTSTGRQTLAWVAAADGGLRVIVRTSVRDAAAPTR